ncbi:Drug/metabolite transporter [Cynara cardunculus var. scolymus]|uniref:WAT1-related protein n=1 Tax=Cynara cardunculus var. scolymus TaxID=59895 RepID=A0A103Y9E5_CYNCS|nr:Drug/metabolite transporter [Cynara cardunculus var. scolymus]
MSGIRLIMSKEWFLGVYSRSKPFVFMVFLQTSYAVNGLIVKSALNKGLNHYTFAAYRNAIAALFFAPFAFFIERKVRPKMTVSIFLKIILLGLLEPVIDQNLFFAGMKYTTATFATAMCNILPAITFVMAWIFRLEKVKMKSLHSQGKMIGTLATIGGAMMMTLIRGPSIQFPWTNHHTVDHHQSSVKTMNAQDQIKGSLMITAGCFSWASFVILQAVTLKSYPAELSLTTLVCMMGSLEGSIVTLERGPVFVTAFNPLAMVIIAIMGSSVLAEKLNLGSVVGALVIVVGLYLVIWGKSKDQNQQHHDPPLNQQHSDDGTKMSISNTDCGKTSDNLETV